MEIASDFQGCRHNCLRGDSRVGIGIRAVDSHAQSPMAQQFAIRHFLVKLTDHHPTAPDWMLCDQRELAEWRSASLRIGVWKTGLSQMQLPFHLTISRDRWVKFYR